MAMVTCASCGAELADGRSVCAACGHLNRTGPVPPPPAATAPPTYAGPSYPPAGGAPPVAGWPGPPGSTYGPPGGWSQDPPPPPKTNGRAIVAAVLIGVVVLALAGVTFALVAADDTDDSAFTTPATSAPSTGGSSRPSGSTIVTETHPRTTAPPPQLRVPVEADGLAWTMVATPTRSKLEQTAPDGSPISARLWSAERTEPANGGDIAIILELEGRTYDMETGLRGAIIQNNGQVINGPSPVEMAGKQGQMMTGTLLQAGQPGYIRVAGVEVDDRVLIVGVASVTDDPDLDEQAFADLVASVHPA